MVIRNVSFKPFFSKEYFGLEADSNFEEELCEWLVGEIPVIKPPPGKTNADTLQTYLLENPNEFDSIVDKAYLFIKSERLTHYVSAINLGAAVYSVSTMSKTSLSVGAKAEIGTDLVATGGVGAKRSKERTTATSKDRHIGDIDIVERGKGEAVVGYEILPLFMLLRNEQVKKLMQVATKCYLDRESKSATNNWIVIYIFHFSF